MTLAQRRGLKVDTNNRCGAADIELGEENTEGWRLWRRT
jgi:hypothetical protein